MSEKTHLILEKHMFLLLGQIDEHWMEALLIVLESSYVTLALVQQL